MNHETENEQAIKFFTECMNILKSKANDYANSGDCFSNFKKIANMTDLSVKKVFEVFLSVKMARINELFKGKTPKNESIDDTLKDLANYACLLSIYGNETE